MKNQIMLILLSVCVLFFTYCDKDDTETAPLKLTSDIRNVSTYNSTDGAIDITVTGGKEPYTFLWSNGATTEDINGLRAGEYSVKVTDAESNVVEESFTLAQPNLTGTMTDIEGNTYKTVLIGNDWWMAENLKVTQDKNGADIEASIYNDDESLLAEHGRLYTWDNAVKSAPEGWHLATDDEWKALEMELGMSKTDADKENSMDRGVGVAAKLLKGGSSGFDATYSGFWWEDHQKYEKIGSYAVFWTATETGADMAWARTICKTTTTVYRYEDPKILCKMSVRCVKDSSD